MMKKLLLSAICCLAISMSLTAAPDKTEALRAEVKTSKNPNITKETHPVLYDMVQELAIAANIPMPRYVTIHEAQTCMVMKDGTVHKSAANNVTAWVNALGDVHICDAILTDLSYQEVKGIVAVAIAESAHKKPSKLFKVGACTFLTTLVGLYALNKTYDLKLGSMYFGNDGYRSYGDKREDIKSAIWLTLAPALITTKLVSNNMQKHIDFKAAKLTNVDQVITGIKALQKLEDTYVKENWLSRVADMLCLKQIFNTIFYPVRAFTPEERVAYLEQLKAAK